MNALRRHRALARIWSNDPGWRGFFTAVNHSDLGRRFIVLSGFFFLVGGLLAMLIRAQLATPHSAFVGPEIYNQIFTMHGTIMMFLFAIPLFEGMTIYLLPKMLGTRDLAFPRLTAYGFWCYAFGGAMLLVSLLLGIAPSGGWFMYPPLSSAIYSPGINADFWLLGITFVEISAIAAAVEITVTILRLRAPGMAMSQMPIYAWYALVVALMILTGFPPLILGSVLLELERAAGLPFFQAELGGDSLLWQHLFWLFGHPEVYIIFLPAAGLISMILPVMARSRLLGYGWIVAAALATAFLSFGLWVHHMFTTGIPHLALAFFSAASTLVAVPTGVQIFAWIGTLWRGKPQWHLPMLHLMGFFSTFVAGGLTGVMIAIVPFDWQVHDTAFITAHLHYVLIGGFVFPMLAAAYFYLPHFTGRRHVYKLGQTAFWLIFSGFHTTFFAMHWLGLLGQPRRIFSYEPDAGWTTINLIASVGAFIMAFGFALVVLDLFLHFYLAPRGPRNRWGATTLEWAMIAPPPPYNFASLPRVNSRDPLADVPDLPLRIARGDGLLADPLTDRRETLGVSISDGQVEHLLVLPGNSALPLQLGLATGALFVALLLKLYWFIPLALLSMTALALRWAWRGGARADRGEQPIGHGLAVPEHTEVARPPGWWGSVFLLVADGTFFASLLFGYVFLWTVAPGWPPPVWLEPSPVMASTGLLAALAAMLTARWTRARLARNRTVTPSSVCALIALVMLGSALVQLGLAAPLPTGHAYGATLLMLAAYGLFHIAIALLMQCFIIARGATGFLSARRRAEADIVRLWVDWASVSSAVVLVVVNFPGYFK